MVITKNWIEQHMTARGGYSRAQLAAIGVPWPPVAGWKERAIGTEISDTAASVFVGGSRIGATPVIATHLQIWTDGTCLPNPGIGGWGWHRCDGASAFGGERATTNNRMELIAILQALRALGDGEVAGVYSDSSYCVNGLTIWSVKWARMSWIKKTGPMPNRDLWIDLAHEMGRIEATIKWVRGHNGDPGNERADELAGHGRASIL